MIELKKEQQIQREKESASCGYDNFMKSEETNRKQGNASNNVFSREVKEKYLADIMAAVKAKTAKVVGYNASEVAQILKQCLKATADGETAQWFDHQEAAFIGLQLTLDTAMNPNKVSSKEIGKHGGEVFGAKWLNPRRGRRAGHAGSMPRSSTDSHSFRLSVGSTWKLWPGCAHGFCPADQAEFDELRWRCLRTQEGSGCSVWLWMGLVVKFSKGSPLRSRTTSP